MKAGSSAQSPELRRLLSDASAGVPSGGGGLGGGLGGGGGGGELGGGLGGAGGESPAPSGPPEAKAAGGTPMYAE